MNLRTPRIVPRSAKPLLWNSNSIKLLKSAVWAILQTLSCRIKKNSPAFLAIALNLLISCTIIDHEWFWIWRQALYLSAFCMFQRCTCHIRSWTTRSKAAVSVPVEKIPTCIRSGLGISVPECLALVVHCLGTFPVVTHTVIILLKERK